MLCSFLLSWWSDVAKQNWQLCTVDCYCSSIEPGQACGATSWPQNSLQTTFCTCYCRVFCVLRKKGVKNKKREAQWPIGYGVGLRIKRSSVRIRPWPLRWVLGQGSLLPLSQGEAFTLASLSYLAILVKYILAKKKMKTERGGETNPLCCFCALSGCPSRWHLCRHFSSEDCISFVQSIHRTV